MEREKRDQEYKAREAERKAEYDAKQKLWEQSQIKKVETHPYLQDMELCEYLIYYCARTHRQHQKGDKADEPVAESTEDA